MDTIDQIHFIHSASKSQLIYERSQMQCLLLNHHRQKMERNLPLLSLHGTYLQIRKFPRESIQQTKTKRPGLLCCTDGSIETHKICSYTPLWHIHPKFATLNRRTSLSMQLSWLDRRILSKLSVSNCSARCHCPLFSQALMVALTLITLGAFLALSWSEAV